MMCHGSAHQLSFLVRPPLELCPRLLALNVLSTAPALLILGPLQGVGHAPGIMLSVDGLFFVMVGIPLCVLVGPVDGLGVRILFDLFLCGHGLEGLHGGIP